MRKEYVTMRSTRRFSLLMICILLTACTTLKEPNSTNPPTPVSALIEAFVRQTDGVCGYTVLRPGTWHATQAICRTYAPPGSEQQADPLALTVVNYRVAAEQQEDGAIAQFEAFQRASSLEGWSEQVEQMWERSGVEATRLETLSTARIYALWSPGMTNPQIVALVIDQETPLGLALDTSDAYADLERLRNAGLWQDFVTMTKSLRAIPHDPSKVTPALSTE
jgi:hypothetical protein